MTKFLKNVDVAGYISQTLVTSALLKTDSSGKLIAATAGTDYQAPTTALLPTGGTAGQILSKIDATNYNTQWIDNFAAQLKHEVKLGATLTKGKAVYVSSANGTNMIVSAASNASEATSSKTLGLLETGGATNDIVKVITEGLLAGLDTSAATAGDPVWLGTSGNLIFGLANKPVAPAHLVFIGIVTRVQSENGEIFVKVQNGFELDELHNVALSSSANNQVLVYESATSLWKNKTIATILGYTPADDSAVVKLTGDQTIAGTKTFTTASHAAQLKFSESGGFSYTAGYTQIGGTASYFSFTNGANTKYAIFNYSGGGWTYTLPNSDGTLALVSQLSSYVPTTRTLTINGTALDLSQDRSWTVGVSGTARNEETFTTTSGQTNFTVTGGYTVGLVDVYVNGVKYAPADFTATTSPTVTISGLVTGDIVDIITYNTTLGNIAGSGTTNYVPKFTATGTIGDSAITDNGTTVTLVSRALSGTSATFSGDLTLNNGAADGGQLVLASSGYSSWNLDNFSGRFRAYYGSTEYFTITSAGNVGIGTTAPLQTFTLSGTQMMYNTAGDGNANTIIGSITSQVRNYGTNIATNSFSSIQFVTNPSAWYKGDIVFLTNGSDGTGSAPTERMRVNAGGDVKFALNITFGTTSEMYIGRGNAISGAYNSYDFVMANFQTSGRVVINASTSGSTGVYLANGSNSWTSWSDERLKTDLVPIENAAEKVSQLRAVTGRYKTDEESVSRSFLIAQDILSVLPEATNLDEATGMYGVQYTDVIPLLVASIKELSAKVTLLENK